MTGNLEVHSAPAVDLVTIRHLISRAAYTADQGSLDDYRFIYSEDAVWSYGDSVQTGLDEIVAASRTRRASGATGPGSGVRHFVTTVDVRVTDDAAVAYSYLLLIKDTAAAPSVMKFLRYEDRLRRTEQGWRISERRNLEDKAQ